MLQKPRQIIHITSNLAIQSPMTRTRLRIRLASTISAAALAALLLAPAAMAQDRSGNFLDNLFNRGDSSSSPDDSGRSGPPPSSSPQMAQSDPGDMSVRIDRLEGALRQLTGTIEQLQYQNQQLQMQMKRMQDDTEYRFQQMGSRGGGAAPPAAPQPGPGAPMNTAPQAPGRRSDAFDPNRDPNAPGAPRTLNQEAGMPAGGPVMSDAPPVGAPGGRDAGAPLDLNTLAGNGAALPPPGASAQANAPMGMSQQSQLPPPPPRNPSATGAQLATLPPTARPQDEYDLAYGYVLHKDYALAEQGFRDFLRKYPDERLVPDAQYWLGESLYQQQRYRDAAESFLAVSTKFERTGKAPDSLLRLGQSLAALNKRDAACATLAEVGRKYPKASAGVKRGVTQEQKRAHC
jgi:tol-pal system protein YbgF